MDKTLGLSLGREIALTAARRVSKVQSITVETPLDDLLPDLDARDQFRENLFEDLRHHAGPAMILEVTIDDLRLDEHETIDDVATFLAGLPGDPGTGDGG